MLRSTRGDAVVFVLTTVATVALTLVTAVELGLAVAVVFALVRLADPAQVAAEPPTGDGIDSQAERELLAQHVLVYRLNGPLFFGASERFLAEITATADIRVVVLRMSSMVMLDATGAHGLGELIVSFAGRGITVLLKGLSPEHLRLL